MDNMINNLAEDYNLILLTEQHVKTLYNWSVEEKHFEYYTCRPLKPCQSFDEYLLKMLNVISEKKEMHYVLVRKENCNIPLGKISLFDLNPRNHSAEFGYYLPQNSRAQGLGSIMVKKFLDISFNDDTLNLNKLYATTCSNNISSVKLLEKFNFKLDGRLREHYWIDKYKYDQLIYSVLKSEYKK